MKKLFLGLGTVLAFFAIYLPRVVQASHTCGSGCNEYTLEGACTHGCSVPGAAPNPDFRDYAKDAPGSERAQKSQEWSNFYQSVSYQQQQAQTEASQVRQEAIAQCTACVNCPGDHLNPSCAKIEGGHHPESPAKPGETRSFQTDSTALRDELTRIEQYNKTNNLTDGQGSYNFFQTNEGFKYIVQDDKGNYVLSSTRTYLTPGAKSAADFGGRTGVWGVIDSKSCNPNGKCTGSISISACDPSEIIYTTRETKYPGDQSTAPAPICTKTVRTTTGTVDCVAEANTYCKFIQIDVQGPVGGAITCYPTDYSKCRQQITTPPGAPGAPGAPEVTTQQNERGGNGGRGTPPVLAPQCNQACGSGCPSNLTCLSGVCRNPACTGETDCTCPGSSFQCQQVKIFRNNVEITASQIREGDIIVFRGFASASNTTVSKIRFVLTKGGIAQTPVDINATLVNGQYQADYQITIDQANSYSVTATPISP